MRRSTTTLMSLLLATALSLALLPSAAAVQQPYYFHPPIAALRTVPLTAVTVELTSLDKSPAPLTRFLAGTRSAGPTFDRAVNLVLDGFSSLLPDNLYYAITDIRRQDGFALVSVIGLQNLAYDFRWTLDNGVWFGLVLLVETGPNRWQGALQGTTAFSALLDTIPDTALSAETKTGLDPLQREDAPTGNIFPWQPGTSMQYVSGIHQNGFDQRSPGWLAVDFISDGNTSAGHAPNQVLAAAAGTIDYICNPYYGQTAAIKVGDLMYTHLVNGSNLYQGRVLKQGEVIGTLQTGSFDEACGVARQPEGQFHLHLGFLKTSPPVIEGWTLDLADHQWYRDGEVRNVRSWFIAGEGLAAQTALADELGGVAGGGQDAGRTPAWVGMPLLDQDAYRLWIGVGCAVTLE